MDFVRTVGDAQRALAGVHLGETEVLRNTAAAVGLDRIVDDLERHVGRLDLDHRDLGLGGLVADLVHHVSGLEAEQTRAFDFDPGFGDALFPDRVRGDRLAESDTAGKPTDHPLQRFFGHADGAHAVVDAARPKAPLRDLEPAAFAQQHVRGGDADVVELDFHVPVGRIVIAEHRQVADDFDAGAIEFHQHHRLLGVLLGFEIGLAHHDRDLAARITCARRPPLGAVEDIFIALALDRAFDVGRVRRGYLRFGHQEGRTDLAVHQRLEPLLLLLTRAVTVKHFHIAGIGRRAVEHFAGKADPAHFLGAERIFEVGQARAFEFEGIVHVAAAHLRRHEQVPDPGSLGLGLLIFDDLQHFPALAFGVLLLVVADARAHVAFDESAHAVAPVDLPFGGIEIHGTFLS